MAAKLFMGMALLTFVFIGAMTLLHAVQENQYKLDALQIVKGCADDE